jgi:hypothetical protein
MNTVMSDGLGVLDAGSALCERIDGTIAGGDGCYLVPLVGKRINLPRGNLFKLECFGPEGDLKWAEEFPNSVTLACLDDVLNVYLGGTTATTTWYLGLVDNAGFTAFASSDTMASHAGWSESTVYSGSNRLAWTLGASSGQSVTNASTVNFAVTTAATIRGLFLASTNDKGGTDGKLFSTASFTGGNQAVNPGDTLKATYTVSATSS